MDSFFKSIPHVFVDFLPKSRHTCQRELPPPPTPPHVASSSCPHTPNTAGLVLPTPSPHSPALPFKPRPLHAFTVTSTFTLTLHQFSFLHSAPKETLSYQVLAVSSGFYHQLLQAYISSNPLRHSNFAVICLFFQQRSPQPFIQALLVYVS